MPGEDRIDTRVMAAGPLALEGVVHLLTVNEESAAAHAQRMESVFAVLGQRVARLSSGDSEEVRAAAYQADVVVGTLETFVVDVGRETDLKITRNVAMVEGGPDSTMRALLQRYRKVVSV